MTYKFLDFKTIIVLFTIVGTAFVANYRLGIIEMGQKTFTVEIASVEADLQNLKLRIIDVENNVEANAETLEDRETVMSSVDESLERHGDVLIRQGMTLKYQSNTLDKILKKLE